MRSATLNNDILLPKWFNISYSNLKSLTIFPSSFIFYQPSSNGSIYNLLYSTEFVWRSPHLSAEDTPVFCLIHRTVRHLRSPTSPIISQNTCWVTPFPYPTRFNCFPEDTISDNTCSSNHLRDYSTCTTRAVECLTLISDKSLYVY